MLKKRYLFLIMLVLLFAISAVSAVDVNNTENLNLELKTQEEILFMDDVTTFSQLQKDIDNSNETFELKHDYKFDYRVDMERYQDGVSINKEIVINGNGFTIDGSNLARIFNVNGYVKFNNITFINGQSTYGGAIYSERYYPIIIGDNNSFINNSASNGGAIYTNSGIEINDNNVFINNIAKQGSGGAIQSGEGSVSIQNNNTFVNNIAVTEGGAIYGRHINIGKNNLFKNNSANSGGAIFNYDLNSRLTIFGNSFFINNSANYGGAIYNSGVTRGGGHYNYGIVNITSNSFFINNSANYGGAIYNGGITCVSDNSSFFNNSANFGGAIYNTQIIYGSVYHAQLELYGNISFTGNRAENGGVIYNNGVIKIKGNSTFKNNFANYGSVIYNNNDISNYLNGLNFNENPAEIIYFDFNLTNEKLIITPYFGNNILYSIYDNTDSDSMLINGNYYYKSDFNKNIIFTVSGTNNNGSFIFNTSVDKNGQIIINLTELSPNYLLISHNYDGFYFNTSEEFKQFLIVSIISPTTFNSTNIYLEASLTKEYPLSNQNLIFLIDNQEYSVITNREGTGLLYLNLNVGNYTCVVKYDGKYGKTSTTVNIVVDKTIDMSVPDVTKYCGGPERLYVTLKDNGQPIADAKIKIYINGLHYDRTTNDNGQASIALSIPAGNYTARVEYDSIETEANVVIKQTVSGNDITKIFRNGTQYYAKFLDTKGNLLVNTPVDFNINGVFYTRTTNENGVAKMNINLNPGEYIITATNPNSKEMYSNVVTVLSNIAENHDLTKYYKNASQYIIRLLDDRGKPVGAGVSVEFNINGVFYTRTSNATGHVKMNINLNPGTYIITANYKGLMVSNTIKVLSILQAKDLNMKFRDGSKFEAKLLDGQGNPFAGQKITFNINGVFYDRTTDENGIARLNINLQADNYIITSSYNGLNIANNIKISNDPIYYTIGSNPLVSDEIIHEIGMDCDCRLITDIYGNTGMHSFVEVVEGITYWCYRASTDWMYLFSPEGVMVDNWNVAEHYR